MNEHWLVIEVETGMMDGFYATEEQGVKALETWRGRRPEYRHMLCNVKVGVTDFGPERFLPNAYYETLPEAANDHV